MEIIVTKEFESRYADLPTVIQKRAEKHHPRRLRNARRGTDPPCVPEREQNPPLNAAECFGLIVALNFFLTTRRHTA